MSDQQDRRGFFSRLGPGLTGLLVLDVVLVAVFAVLLVQVLRGTPEDPVAAPPAGEEQPEPETSPEETPDVDSEDVGALTAFVLPSGNIHCSMDEGQATCTILSYTFEAPAVPEGCDGTVGPVLTVRAGESARFACVEGEPPAVPDGAEVLGYGEQSTVGEMTCASSENGVLCRHNPSGRGFSVARAGYLLL